jgi:RNA polymerase sigma-70 factor (ECF subfamily)
MASAAANEPASVADVIGFLTFMDDSFPDANESDEGARLRGTLGGPIYGPAKATSLPAAPVLRLRPHGGVKSPVRFRNNRHESREQTSGAGVQERESEWAALMRAAIAGDAAAYRRLLAALAPVLRSLARRGLVRTGQSEADSEDLVQETLLAIHLKRHTWDDKRPVGPWIRAIARNKLVDFLRRRGGRVDVPIDGWEEVLPAEENKPPVETRDVERYVNGLPPRQRDVVQCILREEISIRETAARLKMSEGAVRVALHRGLAVVARNYRRDMT